MRIRNAYVVNIDFDGDIYSDVAGSYIFTTEEEVESVIKQALIDLKNGMIKRYNDYNAKVDIDGFLIDLDDVIQNEAILYAFIECGGDSFGNWSIYIDEVI